MPLFIRAGSIIPLGGFIQYADEKPVDPVELRIYPGSNGKFLLYDDENDGYNYEKGVYSEIQIEWHNSESSLVLGKRFGQYPGMPEEFIFNVVIVSEGHGAGLQIEKNPEKSIIYDGEDNTIILSKRVI
jgi:alpha-D-xyloside xylohydrolase